MFAKKLRTTPRSLQEIIKLVEEYPPEARRWCFDPEPKQWMCSGCQWEGCVNHPPPVSGVDYAQRKTAKWINEEDALTMVEIYIYHKRSPQKTRQAPAGPSRFLYRL